MKRWAAVITAFRCKSSGSKADLSGIKSQMDNVVKSIKFKK